MWYYPCDFSKVSKLGGNGSYDGFAQDYSISINNAFEILQSWIKPLIVNDMLCIMLKIYWLFLKCHSKVHSDWLIFFTIMKITSFFVQTSQSSWLLCSISTSMCFLLISYFYIIFTCCLSFLSCEYILINKGIITISCSFYYISVA